MFQRFLVPLDGSKRAEKAIPVAADLARATHGTLLLACIIQPMKDEAYETPLTSSASFTEAKLYLETLLNLYAQELEGLHLSLEVASGPIPSSLFELASQEHQDLIVLCSRGENGLKRWVLGSVAQTIFRQSPLPVLVLNERDQHSSPFHETRPLRILVPQDGSELSEVALTPLFQLLGNTSPSVEHEINLLRVVTMPTVVNGLTYETYIPSTYWEEESQRAKQEQQALIQRLEQTKPSTVHCTFTSTVITSPNIAGTILKQAQPSAYNGGGADYDLIVLATHGRTGLKRVLLRSITEEIFGATTLPLLIVRPIPTQFAEKQPEKEQVKPKESVQSWVGLL